MACSVELLPHRPGGAGTGPAWWWESHGPGLAASLVVRCPHGHAGRLSREKHQVAADGRVHPSVFFKGLCGGQPEWHVWAMLLEWTPEHAQRRATVDPEP